MVQLRNQTSLPEALVLRWNSRMIRARCPYCLYSHGHGFASARGESCAADAQAGWRLRTPGKQRRSDCANLQAGGEYLLVFPDMDNVGALSCGWELDTESCEFVTVNSQGIITTPINDCQDGRTLLPQFKEQHRATHTSSDAEEADDDDEVEVEVDALTLDEGAESREINCGVTRSADALWEELLTDSSFRRKVYFSHCALADTRELGLLCQRSPNDQLLNAMNEEGNTGILLAAANEHGLDTVRWLHENGGSISQVNHYGRTPYMEAALWGRLETFLYLTGQECQDGARDGNGMRAADLACNTPRNRNERMQRSGMIYREPPDAERRREQITALCNRLRPLNSRRTRTTSMITRRAFFDRKPTGELEIYRPQVLLEIPSGQYGSQLQKAFATLDRGPNYPYVNAMSGYSHYGHANVLDNRMWTDKAERLRAMLGLPPDRSLASHVEPQLLAYLLDRHSTHMLEDAEDRRQLETVNPAYHLQPIITVSKPDLCGYCVHMLEAFKARFLGFNVEFHCVGDSAAASLQIRH